MQAIKYRSCSKCFQREKMGFSCLNIIIHYILGFLRTFVYMDHITIIPVWELGGFGNWKEIELTV